VKSRGWPLPPASGPKGCSQALPLLGGVSLPNGTGAPAARVTLASCSQRTRPAGTVLRPARTTGRGGSTGWEAVDSGTPT
jgi:hypothetical protein